MNWHYVEHQTQPGDVYGTWSTWLWENVGRQFQDWSWSESRGHLFICFSREEDAMAFKLKFAL